MTKNVHLDNFIKNIFEDNFAEAKNTLQTVVIEKLKNRMKEKMDNKSEKCAKEDKGKKASKK